MMCNPTICFIVHLHNGSNGIQDTTYKTHELFLLLLTSIEKRDEYRRVEAVGGKKRCGYRVSAVEAWNRGSFKHQRWRSKPEDRGGGIGTHGRDRTSSGRAKHWGKRDCGDGFPSGDFIISLSLFELSLSSNFISLWFQKGRGIRD
ncbi:hypothetical protein PIB30_024428 [Stylosanthes scabra]|uniref:Uncharacterized protein n=1 Tax=Stylosanthes scabra TaxID=79078 RepID=A0ABU6V821_9FABA|nr:hypothetical protein [Stylosanthes scabra]